MSASLEDLIPIVNRLQDLVFNTIGEDTLDLPQVVVVGSQSSGKSSVLENIVGRDFLPRGTGIVTRRPLILQLVNISKDEREYGQFLHTSSRKFYDFDDIRREIEAETHRIAGTNKGIHNAPINLKIFSPHVPNLTLVDLPGVTKVPIGDQPTDIERQTKELVLEYVSKPNALILAVTPANQDLVNSEALKLARQVDPRGERTIGVLTKLDLMDKGTNALDILNGQTYALKLGFIGVVNRSQQDIQDDKSLSDSLMAERMYFQSHPAYRGIAHKLGTAYLSKSLNQILLAHIRERLPDIKARLNSLIGVTEQELSQFGQGPIPAAQGPYLLSLMTKFAASFVGSIDGTPVDALLSTRELCGGARIYNIFHDVFDRQLDELDPLAQLSYYNVRTAILNSAGPRASLFVPELAFDLLVKPQLGLLERPAQHCVQLVYEELMKICHTCGHAELERFPRLQARLIDTISKLLNERLGPTSDCVSSLIEIQKAYINTRHAKFVSAADAMAAVLENNRERELSRAKTIVNAVEDLGIHPESDTSTTGEDDSPIVGPPANSSSTDGEGDDMQTAQRELFLSYFFGRGSQNNSPSSGLASGISSLGVRSGPMSRPRSQMQAGPFASGDDTSAVVNDVNETSSKHVNMAMRLRQERLEQEAAELSPRQRLECDLMFKLIVSYFDIVRETISDQVPKAIMHLLVNFTKESTQTRLVTDLYKESLFEELLYEDETVVRERKKCEETLKTYREAARVINEVV